MLLTHYRMIVAEKPAKYICTLGIIGIACIFPETATSGNFKVSPVKVFLAPHERTAAITIQNMGDETTNLQIRNVHWDQDADGNDVYEDTTDIVVFPKIAMVEKDGESILRLGYQANEPPTVEQTYRIMIEELPVANPGEKALKFNLRMNLPVFVSPLKTKMESTIEKLEFLKGNLAVSIKNNGNTHIFVNKLVLHGLDADGKDVFTQEANGWYTLANRTRIYRVPLNEYNCLQAEAIQVMAEMGKSSMSYILKNYDKTQCRE